MAVPSKRPCTCRRQVPPGGTDVANSHQADPRHTWVIAYRCHLPVLTGFTRPSCAGPSCQHRLRQAVPKGTGLGQEFNLATADCEYRAPLSPHLARPNSTKKWRRERDSNPRDRGHLSTRFPGERLRPTQPSLHISLYSFVT